MKLLPVQTSRIEPGDDLEHILRDALQMTNGKLQADDILVISSKAVATAEGRIVDLSSLTPSEEAKTLSKQCGRSPEFCEAVLEETKKRNGIVKGTCPGAILTELKPWGASIDSPDHLSTRPGAPGLAREECGTILTANAGLDESNTRQGTAVGWPEDPVKSAMILRSGFEEFVGARHWRALWKNILIPGAAARHPYTRPCLAVIVTDSCVRPRRWGVTAFALAVAGIDPLRDEAGREDLFGRKLRITKEAIADQLATAANMLMGNADQSIPAVIIRNHGFTLSDFAGWVPGIEPEEDLFNGII